MNDIIDAGFIPWTVKSVTPLDNHRLFLTFADGKIGIFDAAPLLTCKVYEPLKSPAFFKKARIEGDSVVWDDDTDIAPELLYEQSADALTTDDGIRTYLGTAAENGIEELIAALETAVRAKGVGKIARTVGVNRTALYRLLDGKNKPGIHIISRILACFGLKLIAVEK